MLISQKGGNKKFSTSAVACNKMKSLATCSKMQNKLPQQRTFRLFFSSLIVVMMHLMHKKAKTRQKRRGKEKEKKNKATK